MVSITFTLYTNTNECAVIQQNNHLKMRRTASNVGGDAQHNVRRELDREIELNFCNDNESDKIVEQK